MLTSHPDTQAGRPGCVPSELWQICGEVLRECGRFTPRAFPVNSFQKELWVNLPGTEHEPAETSVAAGRLVSRGLRWRSVVSPQKQATELRMEVGGRTLLEPCHVLLRTPRPTQRRLRYPEVVKQRLSASVRKSQEKRR